jgi:hypothetical protein
MAAGMEYPDPDWSALDDIAPDLRKYLNITNLRPFLRAHHLLTEDEFEQVEISPANPTSQAIDKYAMLWCCIVLLEPCLPSCPGSSVGSNTV